jgi:hypothetical protein
MAKQPDMGNLLKQAQQMQEQLMAAQTEAAGKVLEGHAGGGVVKVTVTGAGEFQSVSIAREVVDPDDVEMLEDLVLAAIHDAMGKVSEMQSQSMGALGDLGGGLGGLLGS